MKKAPAHDSSDSDSDRLRVEESISSAKGIQSRSQSRYSTKPELPLDMPFLSKISDPKILEEVLCILDLSDLTTEEKLNGLEDLVTVATHKQIRTWLTEKENGTDFIPYLKEDKRDLAVKWMEEKKYVWLDALVTQHSTSPKARECFDRWKFKNGFSTASEQTNSPTACVVSSPQTVQHYLQDSQPQQEVASSSKIDGKKKKKKNKNKKKSRGNDNSSEDSDSDDRRRKQKNTDRRSKGKDTATDDSSESSEFSSSSKEQFRRNKRDKGGKDGKKSSDNDFYSAEEEVEDNLKIFDEHLPEEMNIVLLGGTGIGKTTFINSIANMLSHPTLEIAKKNLHVLIQTSFHHIGQDNSQRKIEMPPTIKVEKVGTELNNEDTRTGHSATQAPKSYVFKYGQRGNQRTIRIIDTPGICDVRGLDQDNKNFRHIINFISSFREVHAFLFVLKPNDARLGIQFRYCMNELLTHLHKSATENIIFCMTNGKVGNYKPAETYATLQTYLDDINVEKKVNIQLHGRCFVYDNESYRYMCEYAHGIKHSEWELGSYEESWSRGKGELSKMLNVIAKSKPHDVVNTLSVNKVRRAIEMMSKPLAEIAKTLLMNINLIEEKTYEIQQCIEEGRDFEERLVTVRVQMNTQDLEKPMTVCAHENCIERHPLHENGVEEIDYVTECHVDCYLPNIEPGEPPGERIRDCEIFSDINNENMCTNCGHSYTDHMHMRYRLIVDPIIQEALTQTNNKQLVAQLFLDNLQHEKERLERNLEKKQTICAHFAIFLKKHSVLDYNDQYLAYLNGLIREETDRVDRGFPPDTLNRLKVCKDQYTQLVTIFRGTGGGEAKSLTDIEKLIEEIKNMEDGDIVQDVQNLEVSYPAHLVYDAPAIQITPQYKKIKEKIKKGYEKVRDKTQKVGSKIKESLNTDKKEKEKEKKRYKERRKSFEKVK